VIFVRLTVSVRENRDLFEQARRDPLTALLNRGALQVDLPARIAAASARKPVFLVMFDLNGFKRFNDSFGHPAGDELLADLGRRLRDAVAEDGTPYRIGGDEFCALFGCSQDRFDAALKRSAEALTAAHRGSSVGVSWGVARIPDEASTPSEAMRLADVRMYAQKESRQVVRDAPGEPRPLPTGS
jgi:diguanylate cyclase (GGDEF)-like protein